MEAFGCTRTKGLIYDNFGRAGDYFPISGAAGGADSMPRRRLQREFHDVQPDTRCDYNWNPEAYDPGRALKLACRDSINRNPKAFKSLYNFIKYFEDNRYVSMQLSRDEKLKKLKKSTPVGGPARRCARQRNFFPDKRRLEEAVRARLSREGLMAEIGYRTPWSSVPPRRP